MKRLTLHRLASSLHRFIAVNTIFVHAEIFKKQGKTLPHICKGKERRCFLPLLLKLRKITNSWGNCHWDSLLHRFYALIFLFVKALRQWWQIREAMKRWNRYCGKKLKQWSDEAFNTGKEIEAMKRLTLHHIASSLLVPSFVFGNRSKKNWERRRNNMLRNVTVM